MSPNSSENEKACPSDDQLRQLVDGDIDQQTQKHLETHVLECTVCESRLDSLTDSQQIKRWKEIIEEETRDVTFTPASIVDRTGFSDRDSLAQLEFAGYEIVSEAGRGGMGVVFRAIQSSLNREVAIKTLIRSHDAERVRRFMNEADVIAQITHPNVVTIFEIGHREDYPFIVLEFVDGPNLNDLVRQYAPFDPIQSAQLVQKLAKAAHSAHQLGIIHRDLKPANVLMKGHDDSAAGNSLGDFEPKLTDFGLAKNFENTEANSTKTSVLVGTPAYMAPEQIVCQEDWASPAVDVYALGVVLFELLTARLPFESEKTFELFRKIESEEPPTLRSLNRAVSRDLEAICFKCLEKKPGQRYATAMELSDDLDRLIRREPIRARRISTFSRIQKWAVRRKLLVGFSVAIVTCLILMASFGGYWLSQRSVLKRDFDMAIAQTAELVAKAESSDILQLEGWDAAEQMLRRAEAITKENRFLVDPKPVEELQAQIKREIQLRMLVQKIDQVWMKFIVNLAPNQSKLRSANYLEVFKEFEVDSSIPEEELLARLQSNDERVNGYLIAALHDYSIYTQDESEKRWATEIRRKIDNNTWRKKTLDLVDQAIFPMSRMDELEFALSNVDLNLSPESLVIFVDTLRRVILTSDLLEVYLKSCNQRYVESFWVNFVIAQVVETTGDPNEAIEFLKAAMAKRETPELRFALSQSYSRISDLTQQEKQLKRALELEPEYENALDGLARCYTLMKKYDKAITYYKKVLDKNPGRERTNMQLLQCFDFAKRKQEGREYAWSIVERKGETHEIYHARAQAHAYLKNYEVAIEEYQKAIETQPTCLFCYRELAGVYEKDKQYAKAETQIRNVLRFAPTSQVDTEILQRLLTIQGKLDEALELAEKLVKYRPQISETWRGLGMIQSECEKYDDAIASFLKALELDPRDSKARIELAKTYYLISKFELAEPMYKKAAAQKPTDDTTQGVYIDFLTNTFRFQDAADVASRLVDRKPNSLYAQYKKMATHRAAARIESALAAFEAGRKLDSKPPRFFTESRLAKLQFMKSFTDRFSERDVDMDSLTTDECVHYAQLILVPNEEFKRASDFLAHATQDREAFMVDGMFFGILFEAGYISVLASRMPDLTEEEQLAMRERAIQFLENFVKEFEIFTQDYPEHAKVNVKAWEAMPHNMNVQPLIDEKALVNLPRAQAERCRKLWAKFMEIVEGL